MDNTQAELDALQEAIDKLDNEIEKLKEEQEKPVLKSSPLLSKLNFTNTWK